MTKSAFHVLSSVSAGGKLSSKADNTKRTSLICECTYAKSTSDVLVECQAIVFLLPSCRDDELLLDKTNTVHTLRSHQGPRL